LQMQIQTSLPSLAYLTGAETLPMQSRRPAWLESEMAEHFEVLSAGPPIAYAYNGEFPDYYFDDLDVSASGLVQKLEDERNRRLRVLDVGAAAGGFTLNCIERGHDAQAVSAHNYKNLSRFNTLTKGLDDAAYVIGDANRLADISELQGEYDLIVSRNTFQHLIDTVGTLEQAVNMLAPGGIMAVTGVDIEGSLFYHNRHASSVTPTVLVAGLLRAGFNTTGSNYTSDIYRNRFGTFYTQRKLKGSTDVRFAAGYAGRPLGWRYIIMGNQKLPQTEEVA
jgi:2-polyprenyl-3-methyl-5-hydroxy-6-metoxy-1,4-benzoquinol methylase